MRRRGTHNKRCTISPRGRASLGSLRRECQPSSSLRNRSCTNTFQQKTSSQSPNLNLSPTPRECPLHPSKISNRCSSKKRPSPRHKGYSSTCTSRRLATSLTLSTSMCQISQPTSNPCSKDSRAKCQRRELGINEIRGPPTSNSSTNSSSNM